MDGVREQSPYELLGGEAGLKRIVNRFYDIMDRDSRARTIRTMHGQDLAPMKEKLFQFLSGWLGGPQLYFQRPDAKCMGSAHASFDIGEAERDQWMLCMRRAMEDVGVDEETRKLLDAPLLKLADFMRTR